MTSLLQALAETRPVAADTSVAETVPAVSEEAVRLALQLREIRPRSGARTVLFVPVTASLDAAAVTDDAVRGLLELHEGPVLLMDLRADAAQHGLDYPLASPDGVEHGSPLSQAASRSVVMTRPFAGRRDSVTYASSREFAATLAESRAQNAYVLCIGGPVIGAVETLITASLFDGVVLAVTPRKTTRSDMRAVTAQLRRAHANLIGFVVDERTPRRGV